MTSNTPQSSRLKNLRDALIKSDSDGVIIPVTDEYQGEYCAAYAKRVTWLSGFDGSAGTIIVRHNKAALFVDGRYTLQAAGEVNGDDYEIHNIYDKNPSQWIEETFEAGEVLSYDPWLLTESSYDTLKSSMQKAGGTIEPVGINLIDQIWDDQPERPSEPIIIHPLDYAGLAHDTKITTMAAHIKEKGLDAFLLTKPESICWLLNIRGSDIPHTPFPLTYAIIDAKEKITLFVEPSRIDNEMTTHLGDAVTLVSPNDMAAHIKALLYNIVGYEKKAAPLWFIHAMRVAKIEMAADTDPIMLPKACKNEVEQQGAREAHIIDGIALTSFLHWFDTLTEHDVVDELALEAKLEAFRAEHPLYVEPSFTSIVGSGEHGAIVHYRVDESSNRNIALGEVVLLDSGGQYPLGTTDVTRTFMRGGTAPDTFKTNFTLVLKGHIALGGCQFAKGTTGSQLDVLARKPLWDAGLDYDHGTGHGVGSYLSVHEGPQGISKRGNNIALQEGMILSNEPGYYETGAYGIRIESLVLVKKSNMTSTRAFLEFETLTMAPIDTRLIDPRLLSDSDKTWLNNYHAKVFATLSPLLDKNVTSWLATRCEAI